MQHKVTVGLFDVHRYFKVSFVVFLDYIDTSENAGKYQFKPLLSRFQFNGNEYVKILPRGFVSIDITSNLDRNEEFDTGRFFSMSGIEMFFFIHGLEKLISVYSDKNIKLYYIDSEDDELVLNTEEANKHEISIRVKGNKIVKMVPTVVEQDNIQYEGCCLYINSLANVSYLTISEMLYLLEELKKINIPQLTMETIILYHMVDNKDMDKVEMPKQPLLVEDTAEEEVVDTKTTLIRKEEEKIIPDL